MKHLILTILTLLALIAYLAWVINLRVASERRLEAQEARLVADDAFWPPIATTTDFDLAKERIQAHEDLCIETFKKDFWVGENEEVEYYMWPLRTVNVTGAYVTINDGDVEAGQCFIQVCKVTPGWETANTYYPDETDCNNARTKTFYLK